MSRNVLESRRWLSVCKSSKISAFVGRILIRTAATPAHILLRQHLRSRSPGAPKCIYARHEIFQTSSSRKTIVSPLFCLFVCFLSYRSRSPWSDDFFPRKRFRVDVKRGPRCRVNEKKRKRERETERNRFQTKARGRRVRSPRCEKKNRNKNHFRKRFCVLSFAFPLRPTFARRTFVSSTRLNQKNQQAMSQTSQRNEMLGFRRNRRYEQRLTQTTKENSHGAYKTSSNYKTIVRC